MKVVENSPQNARNCTIFKNFLGGAYPLTKARSFAACISKIPEMLKLGPPLRNSAYAPALDTSLFKSQLFTLFNKDS